jgi:hypothetical protein
MFKDPEVRREYMRRYMQKYRIAKPEFVEEGRKYSREYWHRKRKFVIEEKGTRWGVFKISREEFASILESQDGMCAVCGSKSPTSKAGWHLDHDHKFKNRDRRGWRGVLCHHCNVMIGMAKEDPTTLAKAASYLRKWGSDARRTSQ